jgi:hypothetical protein
MDDPLRAELAAAAARLVVDEGLEYGPAKRKAARLLGAPARRLPDNDAVEDAVRERLALFHADTQPAELDELRAIARTWMQRLAPFRPHLAGAVWRGTATRLSPVTLQLYCDDPKAAEIALIDMGVSFDLGAGGPDDGFDLLRVAVPSRALGQPVDLHLVVLDHDDLRGALKPDGRGRTHCGDLKSLDRLLGEAGDR